MIGDLQQLAPVAKEDEWNLLREHYASPFFFDSKALSESDYLCIELTQVYRQADNTFVRLLNNIRENRFDENTLHTLNQRYIPNFKPNDKAGYITLTTHNYQAQQINNRKLQELPGPAYTYKAEIKDDFPAYSYPTDEVLELKQDAQVMFVKNDSSGERRYYNGKIGRIVFISPSKIRRIRKRYHRRPGDMDKREIYDRREHEGYHGNNRRLFQPIPTENRLGDHDP